MGFVLHPHLSLSIPSVKVISEKSDLFFQMGNQGLFLREFQAQFLTEKLLHFCFEDFCIDFWSGNANYEIIRITDEPHTTIIRVHWVDRDDFPLRLLQVSNLLDELVSSIPFVRFGVLIFCFNPSSRMVYL